ncbi:hypothetical protein D3C71_1690460 [compost metagenome]
MAYLFTVFLSTCALTAIGAVSNDDLVNQVFVEITTKHGLRSVHLGCCLTLFVQEFELH